MSPEPSQQSIFPARRKHSLGGSITRAALSERIMTKREAITDFCTKLVPTPVWIILMPPARRQMELTTIIKFQAPTVTQRQTRTGSSIRLAALSPSTAPETRSLAQVGSMETRKLGEGVAVPIRRLCMIARHFRIAQAGER